MATTHYVCGECGAPQPVEGKTRQEAERLAHAAAARGAPCKSCEALREEHDYLAAKAWCARQGLPLLQGDRGLVPWAVSDRDHALAALEREAAGTGRTVPDDWRRTMLDITDADWWLAREQLFRDPAEVRSLLRTESGSGENRGRDLGDARI